VSINRPTAEAGTLTSGDDGGPGAERTGRKPPVLAAVIGVAAVVLVMVIGLDLSRPGTPGDHPLPVAPGSYVGVFVRGVPESYSPLRAFTAATGVEPNIDLYYSGWHQEFNLRFARQAASHGAIPFVEIDPRPASLAGIASGRYDRYLRQYAAAVRSYQRPVILGFGHEMNAPWYPWGYRHVSPRVFVRAWRHIVTLFRQQGARNVTWLWTVNVIDPRAGVRSPAPWWPGASYVSWIGIDGYYRGPAAEFAPLFGPTIKAVDALTHIPVPILIAEAGVPRGPGQPAKIANLLRGVRAYGLIGLVLFDARDWRLQGRAIAAFRRGASAYKIARP
jgi:mannan endo-1,4-beta-mannosidase